MHTNPMALDLDEYSLAVTRWPRLTFGDFTSRIEREFGVSPSGSALLRSGFYLHDKLDPGDIRCLCAQVGVPAEDFGVEG